jgi:hypothetical protein
VCRDYFPERSSSRDAIAHDTPRRGIPAVIVVVVSQTAASVRVMVGKRLSTRRHNPDSVDSVDSIRNSFPAGNLFFVFHPRVVATAS